ncbi:hypothetical protein V1517DRAFT_331370 [Lipomyces orientalis]|uniref:Uncharacterized protein n=1 Tax=Lipomyces orientalis TaxID=1233043 RepID=A0ACC3TI60_9ASCO
MVHWRRVVNCVILRVQCLLTTSRVQASSTSVGMLISGRIIAGLCIGITSSLVPIYQSEIAPRKQGSGGLPYAFCHILRSPSPVFDRNTMGHPDCAPYISFHRPLLPASIAEMACDQKQMGRSTEGAGVSPHANSDINDPLVLAEYKEIEEQFANSYRELFGEKMRRRLFLGMAVQCLSQFTGVNVILYFIVYILQGAGSSRTLLVSFILYLIFIVATIPTILWTDCWDRRASLLFGSIVIAFWMFVMGGVLGRYGLPTQAHNNLPYSLADMPTIKEVNTD